MDVDGFDPFPFWVAGKSVRQKQINVPAKTADSLPLDIFIVNFQRLAAFLPF
jgi:hypothetical protein